MTVLVYVNTSKQVGDPEHVKVFATVDAARNPGDFTPRVVPHHSAAFVPLEANQILWQK